jgi:anaerobic selenocysteine-containing dehydrogenase
MTTRVVHAACPHDCPDACGVLITVRDGRAIRIQGDPAHPVTRGFLCAKVAQYLDRVYSPDRVLYPYRRIGPKGSRVCNQQDFQRISWDEALDEIATRLQQIARRHGAEAILPYSYGGTLGVLNGASMDRRFFHRLGASQLDRTICSIAGEVGIKSVYGAKLGTEPEQFAYSRYIIAWGANIHGNNVHLWPFIEEARRHGARLVVIDPYRTRTAACADWYLPINPGTDVALALGMMHVIVNENLFDADYVAQHTFGFDQLRARVQEYSPGRVALWTGISADDIVKLAREYATASPAAIRLNYGIQRSDNGGMAVRAVCMLPCLIGAWKQVGGGLQLSTGEGHNLNKNALKGEELMPRPTRVINMVELGRALNEVNDPPVQALFVYNSNPAAVAPNHNSVVRGLLRTGLFTVVHEQFFTDTTDYADIILPATTFFEHKDLQTGYGHYYIQISNQAVEPLGECRSNVELFRALALRMGFDDACFRESVDDMIDLALSSEHPHLAGIDRARLQREHFVRLNLPQQGNSATESRNSLAHRGSGGSGTNDMASAEGAAPGGFYLPFAHGFPTPTGKALQPGTRRARTRSGGLVHAAQGIASRRRCALPARTAGPQVRQLSQLHVRQSSAATENGKSRSAGDRRRRRPGARHCGWRSRARVQRPRRNSSDGAGQRRHSPGRGGGTVELGQAHWAGPQHQRPDLGAARRHGRRRYLLFRPGGSPTRTARLIPAVWHSAHPSAPSLCFFQREILPRCGLRNT